MKNLFCIEESLGKIIGLYEGVYFQSLFLDKDVDPEGFRKIQHQFLDILIDKLNDKYSKFANTQGIKSLGETAKACANL
jgi:hypothetical protein